MKGGQQTLKLYLLWVSGDTLYELVLTILSGIRDWASSICYHRAAAKIRGWNRLPAQIGIESVNCRSLVVNWRFTHALGLLKILALSDIFPYLTEAIRQTDGRLATEFVSQRPSQGAIDADAPSSDLGGLADRGDPAEPQAFNIISWVALTCAACLQVEMKRELDQGFTVIEAIQSSSLTLLITIIKYRFSLLVGVLILVKSCSLL